MLEIALKGKRAYWIWIAGLLLTIGAGVLFYTVQLKHGLMLTGQSRDVSWGFYTAQMTFLVGVAAGGVMLVLPYYLHDYEKLGQLYNVKTEMSIPLLSYLGYHTLLTDLVKG